ncbi:MAG: ribosome-recycling factor [bacterium]
MAYNFSEFKKGSTAALEWLRAEYSGIRTGQATPSILDKILVPAYGSKTAINQLATITVEGAKSLRIIPWDKGLSQNMDASIREANLGLAVSVDDQGLQVSFPELSSERRSQLLKLAKEKMEEARIRLRSEREKVLTDVDKQEKMGTLSEDDKFRIKTELQKLVDESNGQFEELSRRKEKEISE